MPTSAACENTRTTNAVSQSDPSDPEPSPNAENAPFECLYCSCRWYPMAMLSSARCFRSDVSLRAAVRYEMAATFGAIVIIFCSPHPNGT